MKYKIGMVIWLAPLLCQAAIYMQKDQQGNVSYSDTPTENSKIIDAPPPVNYAPPLAQTPSSSVPEQPVTPAPYQAFVIENPIDQQTFQNQRTIPVEIKIDPPLQQGDKIQLYVDKKPWGNLQEKTQLVLTELERGTHQIHAEIIDSSQKSIKQSNTVTIYIHYAHLGTQTPSLELQSKSLTLMQQLLHIVHSWI